MKYFYTYNLILNFLNWLLDHTNIILYDGHTNKPIDYGIDKLANDYITHQGG